MGGKSRRKGMYVYIWLTHIIVQQKLTQCSKQLYSNNNKERNWFMQLWRLGKSRICRAGLQAGDPGKSCSLSSDVVS